MGALGGAHGRLLPAHARDELSAPELTRRALNRALLARQGLLAPFADPLPAALERVGGLQAQYAPSMYVGLWTRRKSFARAELTAALEAREVVQATLIRVTIHLVSRGDFWPLALATREARRRAWLRSRPGGPGEDEMAAAGERLRAELAGGAVLARAEVERLVGKAATSGVGQWVDLVRAPPSGTWERRRADLFALAEDWIGPPPALSAQDAVVHLVRRYLGAFGPATRADVASFTGLRAGALAPALEEVALRSFRGPDGQELLDVADAPLPDPGAPAPVAFLPTWDATLLVHARRTGILPEEHRPRIFTARNPHSTSTFLVDGEVRGTWRFDGSRVELEPFAPLDPEDRRRVEAGAERLAAFHA